MSVIKPLFGFFRHKKTHPQACNQNVIRKSRSGLCQCTCLIFGLIVSHPYSCDSHVFRRSFRKICFIISQPYFFVKHKNIKTGRLFRTACIMLFIIAFKNTSLALFFLIKQDISMAEKLAYLKRGTA